ncbi:AraC-type DNA-binding protein [Solimonas aquatica]|uniref:AraC-type DNA-binding protein n=1 Tax=Solimonas aquatica TaxID=489703 RepID=A0A1H9DKV6_9GAMM|nr:AraC family transcriptional regulator [Solimonas aquatica]SEQ14125.1 AraC-type DNA-binding protein [Solimonas aquatica]
MKRDKTSQENARQASGYGIYLLYAQELLREQLGGAEAAANDATLAELQSVPVSRRLSAPTMMRLFVRLFRDPRCAGIFLRLGERVPALAHGCLGAAAMASRDLRQVLELLERYAPILLPGLRIHTELRGDELIVQVQTASGHADFDAAMVEATVGNLSRQLPKMIGCALPLRRVQLMRPPPAHAAMFEQYAGCPVSFGAVSNQLVFPASLLSTPVPSADPVNLRLLLDQCDEEMARLREQTSLGNRVRELIAFHLKDEPSLERIARALHQSERTLRRRLREEGLSFRELLNQVRRDKALYYLEHTQARIGEIASELGYRDIACFRHAFKDLMGRSPRAWRERPDGATGEDASA